MYYIQLDKLPFNSNGKIDRKAIAELEKFDDFQSNSFVAPENEIEILIRNIWVEVLKLDAFRIGVNDSFLN